MLKYLFYLIFDVLFMVICYIINPVVALFANSAGYLPFYLSWFGTHDNPIDGDAYFQSKYPGNSKWKQYRRRVLWLYRNTGYTFRYNVLGYTIDAANYIKYDHLYKNFNGSDHGWLFAYDKSMPWYLRGWSFYMQLPYGTFDYGIRIYIGWKFKGLSSGRKMFAHSINPFYPVNG